MMTHAQHTFHFDINNKPKNVSLVTQIDTNQIQIIAKYAILKGPVLQVHLYIHKPFPLPSQTK